MMDLHALLANPITKGAIAGIVTAASVDFQAFRSWHTFHDAVVYSWSTAAFRWVQGAILGAVAAAGLGTL